MNNRRTAILMLKYINARSNTEEDVSDLDIISKFTDNEFERNFIVLASYWSNDMIELCLDELGIPQPYLSYVWPESQDWAKWFEKMVGDLVIPND